MSVDYNCLRYKITIDEKYYCKQCYNIYNKVIQVDCGCRYCDDCLSIILSSGKCTICNEELAEKSSYIDKAYQKELERYPIECVECNWNGPLLGYLDHYKQSHKGFVCKYCKTAFEEVTALEQHFSVKPNGSCKQTNYVECIYKSIGCPVTNLTEQDLREHIIKDAALHLECMYNYAKKYASKTHSIVEPFQQTAAATASVSSWQQNFISELKDTCSRQDSLLKELESTIENEKLLQHEIDTLKSLLLNSQSTIIELEQRLKHQEKTTFNGVYVWKITNVKEKILEAQTGKKEYLDSTSFFTHSNGYKFCARIYLNGEGKGKGTHLSLFIMLMKGEYDGLLKWPFNEKITFVLIDQLNDDTRHNITNTFTPDKNSSSFGRPVSNLNVPCGITFFCSLTELNSNSHEYIKDDTIFVKISVNTNGLINQN